VSHAFLNPSIYSLIQAIGLIVLLTGLTTQWLSKPEHALPAETLPNLLLKKAMQLIKAPLKHTESGILSPSPTTSKYYLDPSKTVVP